MNQFGGFWVRAVAFVLDNLILCPLGLVYLWSLSESRELAMVMVIPFHLALPSYMVVIHGLRGQSLGKMALGLTVRCADGRPLTWRSCVIRFIPLISWRATYGAIILFVLATTNDSSFTGMPFISRLFALYVDQPVWAKNVNHLLSAWVLAEAVTMVATAHKQSIHDFLGGTVVVKRVVTPPPLESGAV